MLKFKENKTGNSECAIKEMGLADVCDPAINQGAGVQQFHTLHVRKGNFHREWKRELPEIISLGRADDQAEVAERKERGEFEERPGGFRLSGAGNHEGKQERREQTEHGTEYASHKSADLRAAQS